MEKGEGCFNKMMMTFFKESVMFKSVRWCCKMREHWWIRNFLEQCIHHHC